MQGQRGLSTNSSEYNAQDFMISQMLGRIATAEPVRVVAVSGSGVSPVGFVDVQPLINLVTGEQKALPALSGRKKRPRHRPAAG